MGGALVIAAYLRCPRSRGAPAAPKLEPKPNAFIRIAPDDTVTVIVKHLDKGQASPPASAPSSPRSSTRIGADARRVRAGQRHALQQLLFGPIQATGGSSSVANSWMQCGLPLLRARDAGCCRCAGMAGAGRESPSSAASLAMRKGQDRAFRRAGGEGGVAPVPQIRR